MATLIRLHNSLGALGRSSFLGKVPSLTGNSSDRIRSLQQATQTRTQLPKLPVPSLNQTLQKYLRTVKPLVTDDEYQHTEQLVKEFGSSKGIGEKLQLLLENKAENSDNWLSDWWLSTAYLEYRWPVVMYSSPGLVFPLQQFQNKDDQLSFAAKVIVGALQYKELIDRKQIPVEMMGNKPLDMSQYSMIFNTCRLPGEKRDNLVCFADDPNPPTHIIVVHNNQFFKLSTCGKNGTILSENQVLSQLYEIVAQSSDVAPPVGILTSENRNVWGKAYKKLKKDAVNSKSLNEIHRGIFLVCIDQPNPHFKGLSSETVSALQMIHGSRVNSGNRWYDKTIQFVVGTNGEVGLTYEHSPAEGPPVANLMDHIMVHVGKNTQASSAATEISPPVRLNFNIDNETKETIKAAARDIDVLVKDLDMIVFKFCGYGKNFIKSQKLSPDSYIQMAIQLAFYRIHGEPGACYESASTRQFCNGRTETIRSTSIESVEFCKAILNPHAGNDAAQALRTAIDAHKKYATEAVNGHGVDRHLLGLKLIAIENGLDVPRLYLDAGYSRSCHFRISTSQVAAKCDAVMCYGPLVPDGYACCYNPKTNDMLFGISACNSSPETNAESFRDALDKSLNEMHDVLSRAQKAKL